MVESGKGKRVQQKPNGITFQIGNERGKKADGKDGEGEKKEKEKEKSKQSANTAKKQKERQKANNQFSLYSKRLVFDVTLFF